MGKPYSIEISDEYQKVACYPLHKCICTYLLFILISGSPEYSGWGT